MERLNSMFLTCFSVVILSHSRKLIRIFYEQRELEENKEERSGCVQRMAEAFGLE